MDVILQDEVRATILGNHDGLTDADLMYIRRRTKKLARNLRRKYEFLGKATGEARILESHLNLEERRLRIIFKRMTDKGFETEAVMDVQTHLLKPKTKKQLAELGLETDPDIPSRAISLNGRVYRYGIKNTLPVNDFHIRTIPATSTQLFNSLIENGFLKHPRQQNYIPLLDSTEPLEPIGRREMRMQAKRPLQMLDAGQREYITSQFRNLRDNFKHRYGHLFDNISYDYDMEKRSFSLSLTASKAFAGHGAHDFSLQAEFALIWRNQGKSGTHIDLTIKGGLSREFHEALKLTKPISIDTKNRAAVSDRIFEILAFSGKISVADYKSSRAALKEKRFIKPSRAEISRERGSDRRAANMQARRLVVAGYHNN